MSETLGLVMGILGLVCVINLWRTRSSIRRDGRLSLGQVMTILILGLNLAIGATLQFVLEGGIVLLLPMILGWTLTAWFAWLTWLRQREKRA